MYWRPGKLHLSPARVGGHRDDLELAPSPRAPLFVAQPLPWLFPNFRACGAPPPTLPLDLPTPPEPTTPDTVTITNAAPRRAGSAPQSPPSTPPAIYLKSCCPNTATASDGTNTLASTYRYIRGDSRLLADSVPRSG